MSKEHNHHHDETKHDNHAKPSIDCCALWLTMVKKGIWVVYPIMGVCFLHVFWLMNDRIDNIMYNSVPIHDKPAPFVDIKSPVEGAVQKGMDLKLIKTPSAEMIKLGKSTYQTTCVACHGPEGFGGIAGSRNFHSKENWKNGMELRNMFTTITNGIPGTGMASFDMLPVETRISLIHYIRSFANVYPEVTDLDVETLDKQYNLSKETSSPHRVPVLVAQSILVNESAEKVKLVHELNASVSHDESENALLLKSYSDNLEKTLVSFHSNSVWKKDLDSFVKFLTVNIGANGVKSEILLLDKSKVEGLYTYLKGIYK